MSELVRSNSAIIAAFVYRREESARAKADAHSTLSKWSTMTNILYQYGRQLCVPSIPISKLSTDRFSLVLIDFIFRWRITSASCPRIDSEHGYGYNCN